MTLDQILEMWEKDCQVDQYKLDNASIETVKMHSKYLQLLTNHKLKLKQKDAEFKILLKKKWLWYNGKMSKDEMDRENWDYDPLNGLKILKGDMDRFYDSDPDIQKAKLQIDYIKTIIETLEEIMNTIRWRHSHVKNIIEWRKFESGG